MRIPAISTREPFCLNLLVLRWCYIVYSDTMCTLVQSASTEPPPCYEEVRQLREINQRQHRMIRQWESWRKHGRN